MGWQANKATQRTCKDCKQSLYGNAADLAEHARTCARLNALNLTVPGLLVGQDAVSELNRVGEQLAQRRTRQRRWG